MAPTTERVVTTKVVRRRVEVYLIEARGGGQPAAVMASYSPAPTARRRRGHASGRADDGGPSASTYTAGRPAKWPKYRPSVCRYMSHRRAPGRPGRTTVLRFVHSWRPRRRLGRRDPPAPGGPAVDGVVDYATDRFLGVRTADALVRFHGRWAIGMAVAVSHHAYAGLDPAAAAAAWTSWLAAVLDGTDEFRPAGAS